MLDIYIIFITNMTYNKDAQARYKEKNLEKYSMQRYSASCTWRSKNMEHIRLYDRWRKSPFMVEWRSLRNIDLF